jgi:sulfur-oxidizing protein SoxZ
MAIRRIRAKVRENVTVIKAIIKHPMETGQRKDKSTGKKIPAHFIQMIKISVNGVEMVNAYVGPAVSKNPLFHIEFKGGKKGDKVEVSWLDNKGQKETGSVIAK